MQVIPLEEAQGRLSEIIDKLAPGEEVVIIRDNLAVARIVGEKRLLRPGPGLCKGMITVVSDDDDHLQDFAEHMP